MSQTAMFEKLKNPYGAIKHVIAVMSGKGGVGKSSVTALLAAALRQKGFEVGVLDADITGPSIPRLFGLKHRVVQDGQAMLPVTTDSGIKVISINLLLEQDDQPVIWRGPLVGGVVKQFFEEVKWGDLDCLLVDLPPGTGDVPLTVMQSLPLDGVIIVTSPQELVALIVKKALHMVGQMNIPVLGIVENMSYLECPECKKEIELFGPSQTQAIATEFNLKFLGRLPLIPEVARLSDAGRVEAAARVVPESFARFMAQIEDDLKVESTK